MSAVRVLVAEGSPTYMAALRRALTQNPRVVLEDETADGSQVVSRTIRSRPDVALLDLHLPGQDGLAVAGELRRKAPEVKIVLLLSDDAPAYRAAASDIGARWVAKDRLVEELPRLLEAPGQASDGWNAPEGGVVVDRVKVDVGLSRPQTARPGVSLAPEWGERLAVAAKPASAIFLIGIALLALTTFLSWDLHSPVARDTTGGTRIVDELGQFGPRGAVAQLSREQTDAYVATLVEEHRRSLLLCVGLGTLGLAVGAALIAWYETQERRHDSC